MREDIKYTLLLCTLNRADAMKSCLDSIRIQSYRNFEVIVVDQSEDDKTEKLCEQYQELNLKYIKVSFRGLSRARNYGLKYAEGDYVSLIDDDAVYSANYLQTANLFLMQLKEPAILCGRLHYIDAPDKGITDYSIYQDRTCLSIKQVFKVGYSASLILPREALISAGGFDEQFGVGAQYGSGEETDVILRLTRVGIPIYYLSDMLFYHGYSVDCFDENMLKKTYSYYLGNGALIKKHLVLNRDFRMFDKCMRLTVGAVIKWVMGSKQTKQIYNARIRGFIDGYKTYRR